MKTINEQLAEQMKQGQEKSLNRPKHQSGHVKESIMLNDNAEKTLSFIAEIFLIGGLGIAAVLLIIGLYQWNEEVSLQLLIFGLLIACVSVVNWAILRVLCNISNSLKGLYRKMSINEQNN